MSKPRLFVVASVAAFVCIVSVAVFGIEGILEGAWYLLGLVFCLLVSVLWTFTFLRAAKPLPDRGNVIWPFMAAALLCPVTVLLFVVLITDMQLGNDDDPWEFGVTLTVAALTNPLVGWAFRLWPRSSRYGLLVRGSLIALLLILEAFGIGWLLREWDDLSLGVALVLAVILTIGAGMITLALQFLFGDFRGSSKP